MRCPYCYVPFTGRSPDFAQLAKVLRRCFAIGFRIVTFGGGDPLMYPEFRESLRLAHQLGFEVQLDSNAICVTESDFELFNETLSLIALPLDGPDSAVHSAMRESKSHFDAVVSTLNQLANRNFRLKINTMVGKANISQLRELQIFIDMFRVDIWSVYQFMAVDGATKHSPRYEVCDDVFRGAVSVLDSRSYKIEIGTADSRHSSYLFVTPDGEAYTHSVTDYSRYETLGSVFEDKWASRFRYFSTLRAEARHRYLSIPSSPGDNQL